MARVNWYGVVDIEFLVDPRTNDPKLMGINPRFWSSLQLAIECGVDFPWLLTQLSLGNDADPVLHYALDMRAIR